MKKAIIDIGSNTIHVIIAEMSDVGWHKLAEYKSPARLAEGGIDKNILMPEAIERGVQAIRHHKEQAQDMGCEIIEAFATAAVRDANNQQEFIERVKNELDIDIQVISGDREAELIAHGIMASGALHTDSNLIMDIGGGSTEFILVKNGKIEYKQSFRLGVTRLIEKFNPSDPLTEKEQVELLDYFANSLTTLQTILTQYQPIRLVGASGSFDSLAQMHALASDTPWKDVSNAMSMEVYRALAEEILHTDHITRSRMPGLAAYRVDTIVMAVMLIKYVLSIGEFKELYQSSYALKEGVLAFRK